MQSSKPKAAVPTTRPVVPWNKGALVGPKPPLKPKQVWSLGFTFQHKDCIRDLALFDLAIESKLRGCDIVQLRIGHRSPPVVATAGSSASQALLHLAGDRRIVSLWGSTVCWPRKLPFNRRHKIERVRPIGRIPPLAGGD